MQWREMQQAFYAALLHTDYAPLAAWVQTGGAALDERLEIYRGNVYGNLTDALKDTFAATHALVGEAFFEQMAWQFIRQCPPRAACLIWYGEAFPAFIAGHTPVASMPYLAEVAHLEWARQYVCFSAEDTALDTGWLEAQTDETLAHLVLTLRACVRLVEAAYPVLDIWEYTRQPDTHAVPDINTGGQKILMWRTERQIHHRLLTAAEYAALSVFAGSGTLAAAIEAAMLQQPELRAEDLLAMMFQLHILRDPRTITHPVIEDTGMSGRVQYGSGRL